MESLNKRFVKRTDSVASILTSQYFIAISFLDCEEDKQGLGLISFNKLLPTLGMN